jgi:hypothetical protein
MAAAGQNPSSDTARGGMLSICNQFFWYKAVLDSAPSVDREGVRAAAAALGERPSPTGEVDRWRPGKPWGTGQYRVTVFNGGCRCFEYKVGPVVVG